MRIGKIGRISLHMAIMGAIATAFVNCSKIGFNSSSNSGSSVEKGNQGNGDNYDGKLYVHLDPKNPCPDGGAKRSSIQLNGNKFSLVRDNCAEVTPPQALADADVQIDPNIAGLLKYKSKKYIFDSSPLLAKPADLNCVKKNFGPLDSVKLYNVTGPKGAMVVGAIVSKGQTIAVAADSATIVTSPSTAKMFLSDQEAANTVTLSDWGAAAAHPDGTNSFYQLSQGTLGAEGYVYCLRPGGTL